MTAAGEPVHVAGPLVHSLLELVERQAAATTPAEDPPERAPLLTPWGVAERLNVPVGHVGRLVNQHGLPVVRVGPAWRFRPADVDAWVERRVVRLAPGRGRAAARPRAGPAPRLRRVR